MILTGKKMEGQDLKEERIKSLEKEIKELNAEIEELLQKKDEDHRYQLLELENQFKIKEEILLNRLKDYESAFYKELTGRVQILKKSWTWRIGRLFVGPADLILKPFLSKKDPLSDRTTALKIPVFGASGEKPETEVKSFSFDFENQVKDLTKTNIAVIFDTFTQSCFSPEFNTICFTPANWKEVLGNIPVKGLFIESAWRGVGDTWREKVVAVSVKTQPEINKLLDWARNQKIPSIFWNKEDPVHFEHFIKVAKRFDYIFTTDAGCIPEYQKHAPKAVVNALPFAAQPKIHNPVVQEARNKSVCFAGTYYNQRYHERKADMDFLLKPSLAFGLEIYDRNFGDTGKDALDLAFPDIYQDAIKGKLDYKEMVKAYKQYKVFLNVNSVRYSPTMFARRVFEILASGTPVISTYSSGIVNVLGEGTVFLSESEAETIKHLEYLLGDEQNWWKASLNGLRKVMEHHTYQERSKFIFDITGLDYNGAQPAKFSVISRVSNMAEIEYLEKILRPQSFTGFDIVLIMAGGEVTQDQIDTLNSLFAPYPVKLFKEDMTNLEAEVLRASGSDFIAFFHADKYYGPNYLKDYSLAVKYASPRIMGKKSFHRLMSGDKFLVLDKGFEYQYVMKVSNATSVHRKADFNATHMREYLKEGSVMDIEQGILSIDPYNFADSELPLRKEIFLNPGLVKINL
jgi:spore maturation protein CgeB